MTMSDDDLIRRDDVLAILAARVAWWDVDAAVRALPAVTPHIDWDAADAALWANEIELLECYDVHPEDYKNDPEADEARRAFLEHLFRVALPAATPRPMKGTSRDRGKMVKPKPGDMCGGYATEGGSDD
jgi:hypothetical protein